MSRPPRQVFVCTQARPPQHPRGSCATQGSSAVLQAFWAELQKRQAYEHVAITYCGCLGGPCDGGPNVLVYPENVLYSRVTVDDVADIFTGHLEQGQPVQRLLPARAA